MPTIRVDLPDQALPRHPLRLPAQPIPLSLLRPFRPWGLRAQHRPRRLSRLRVRLALQSRRSLSGRLARRTPSGLQVL